MKGRRETEQTKGDVEYTVNLWALILRAIPCRTNHYISLLPHKWKITLFFLYEKGKVISHLAATSARAKFSEILLKISLILLV